MNKQKERVEIKEGIHWIKLTENHKDKTKRKIFNYKCQICNEIYKNHRNARAHCEECLINHSKSDGQLTLDDSFKFSKTKTKKTSPFQKNPPYSRVSTEKDPNSIIPGKIKVLVELIADNNLSYTQLSSPSWMRLIYTFDPDFEIPSHENLRSYIISYSKDIKNISLNSFRGRTIGLAIDGATFRKIHYYAVVMIAYDQVRLYDVFPLENQNAASISKAMLTVYNDCKLYDITIAGVVSDNGAPLKAALTGSHPLHLPSLLGEAILRVACGAHSSQLAIVDATKKIKEFKDFTIQILDLLKWVKKHEKELKDFVSSQVPDFIITRWNTLCMVTGYFVKNEEMINEFISFVISKEQNEYREKLVKHQRALLTNKLNLIPQVPEKPQIQKIPQTWKRMLDILEIIAEFTTRIEGDTVMQQDLYIQYKKALNEFDLISNRGNTEDEFKQMFIERFKSTANIRISQIAYIFTAKGLKEYREEGMTDRTELTKVIQEIGHTLLNDEYNDSFITASFDHYLDNVEFPIDQSSRVFWKLLQDQFFTENDLNDGKPISLKTFSKMATLLLCLPATEAITERCFSSFRRLLSDYNSNMLPDLFIALCTVKMHVRYKNKYPLK